MNKRKDGNNFVTKQEILLVDKLPKLSAVVLFRDEVLHVGLDGGWAGPAEGHVQMRQRSQSSHLFELAAVEEVRVGVLAAEVKQRRTHAHSRRQLMRALLQARHVRHPTPGFKFISRKCLV